MIAEVMRWCDEQLTIDHNLVPTTPGRRAAPLAHLHPDWFTALLLCGKNSLAITKLSSRPYFIKYAFLHFLFTKLKSNVEYERKDSNICQISVQTERNMFLARKFKLVIFRDSLCFSMIYQMIAKDKKII